MILNYKIEKQNSGYDKNTRDSLKMHQYSSIKHHPTQKDRLIDE